MANREVKIGDVVVLRSGGPKMTVINTEPLTVYTTWFGTPALPKPEIGTFPSAAVEHVDDRRG